MKIMRIALVAVVISILTTIFSSANLCEEHSWYIKRNGNLQPRLDATQQMIKDYNAYYLDTSLSDTSEDKKIYLTFDLGYDNGNTERILDTLKKENITAAFFILANSSLS